MAPDPAFIQKKLLAALGTCRGVLYSVLAGDVDPEDVQRALDQTSLASLAKSLGMTEDDLAGPDDPHAA